MASNIQLSPSFNLLEMITSQQATRFAINEQFDPPQDVIENLHNLCINILQPLRDRLGKPVRISSGYRCPRLNKMIGGVSNSQHLTGHAADIQNFEIGNEQLFKAIIDMKLPFDQIINEFNFSWVHVSFDANRTRGQILKID